MTSAGTPLLIAYEQRMMPCSLFAVAESGTIAEQMPYGIILND
jgi:hypothetical protein